MIYLRKILTLYFKTIYRNIFLIKSNSYQLHFDLLERLF